MGGTDPARHAGAAADTKVTTTPVPRARRAEAGRTTSDVRMPMSSVPTSRVRPTAARMPSRYPATAASTPRASASATTVPTTWRRLAPSARRSAISGWRCATTNASEVAITSPPTATAARAKVRTGRT